MKRIDPILHQFRTQFGPRNPPRLFRAPGRVNLIGEHTDYNDGFVLPAAIDRQIILAATPRRDHQINVYSQNFDQWDRFQIEIEPGLSVHGSWGNYLRSMIWVLLKNGYTLKGMDAVIGGDIPMGAGLSSSAAMEVVVGFALLTLAEAEFTRKDLALMAQQAENEFVGMRCGIMDQFISCLGRCDHALLIDCRDLSHRSVPLSSQAALVIVDSSVHRGLVEGEYNTRRSECEAAAKSCGVAALRDINLEDFNRRRGHLSEKLQRRARHVISENERTIATAEALANGDLTTAGKHMRASHNSLRDDFQVSVPELDRLVDSAMETSGVYGARMTGAGFGGCMVALVQPTAAEVLLEKINKAYPRSFGYICRPSAGVSELT